ncbi:ranBP-type and C3HC4-type zinc finger-containing protein 1 [Scyliorhinus canicula]|uniref:ranBP-type and C3HC4-type zinc finger-containing protein 1 n=1 Tax=Scyliorhinus canicula TaxID=7830 RepID=UPI0018F49017|nr:ranBP-type and C3HC4-type zinc finger-containing protein 1 [Scyliorhinus canicula]
MAAMAARGPAPPQLTVLMSCRVREEAAGGPGGGQGAAVRLQLSMERPGEFRLAARLTEPVPGRSPVLHEFNLKDVLYEFKSTTCHRISTRSQPTEQLTYHFEDEREAQKWSTIITSSLREIEKASSTSGQQNQTGSSGTPLQPAQPVTEGGPGLGAEPTRAGPHICRTGMDISRTGMDISRTEDLIQELTKAIESGDSTLSSECAVTLAQRKVCLGIWLKDVAYPNQQISVRVGVEDAASSATIIVKVFPYTTVSTLKQQVTSHYVVEVRLNSPSLFELAQCVIPLSLSLSTDRLPQKERDGRMDISNIAQRINLELKSLQPLPCQDTWNRTSQQASSAPSPTQAGWACNTCTYINKPTRPGCEMCSSPRPPEYSVPQDYKPDDEEMCRILQEKEAMRRYQQELEEKRLRNYQNLLQLDGQHLVLNHEPIECRICLMDVKPREGVVLRDCLHSFCRDCLKQLIRSCTDPQVSCPFRDESYACDSKLQEREVRALVSLEDYDKFLDRGMSVAESSSANSYHCRTADCRGWCIYEDTVNEFRCPICSKLNCLLCKEIHEGMNCKQYQDDLRSRALNDSAARRTTEMLTTMVQNGEAMHCPKCKIIVQKKDGCDWLRCPVCHTEICWVTKGYRWGPGGPGDRSGGCRCLVNGQRCHPLCQNCH